MSRIHLKRLEIRELFERPFDLKLENLSERVTIVYGPNASGKSSLTYAASRVFCTRLMQPSDHVRATLSYNDAELGIELRGPRSSNPLPQSSRPNLYVLSIPDLIVGPSADDTQLIRDALAGGLDLAKCLPSKGRNKPDLDSPKKVLDDRRIHATTIAKQEMSLDNLERQRAKASQSAQDLQVVENWIQAAGAEAEAEVLEAAAQDLRQQFPGIESQQPNACDDIRDAKRLLEDAKDEFELAVTALGPFRGKQAEKALDANHEAELKRLKREADQRQGALGPIEQSISQSRSQIRQAESKLSSMGRATKPIDPAIRQSLAGLLQCVMDAQSKLSDAAVQSRERRMALDRDRRGIVDAGGELESAELVQRDADLVARGIELDREVQLARDACGRAEEAQRQSLNRLEAVKTDLPKVLDAIKPADIISLASAEPTIADVADKVRETRNERSAYNRIVRSLQDKSDELKSLTAEAEKASRALADWLRDTPEGTDPKKLRFVAAVAICLTAVVLLCAILGAPKWVIVVAAAGLTAVIGIALLGYRNAPGSVRKTDSQALVPETWRPANWTAAEVVSKLQEALRCAMEAEANANLLREARVLAENADPTNDQAVLDGRLAKLREKTGFDFEYPYHMALLVRHLAKYQEALDECGARELDVASSKETLTQAVAARTGHLKQCKVSVETGEAFKTLASACGRYLQSKSEVDLAEQEHVDAERCLDLAQQAYFSLLAEFGWPTSGDPEAARDQFLAWLDLTQDLSELEIQLGRYVQEKQRLGDEDAESARRLAELFDAYGHPTPECATDGIESFFSWFEISKRVQAARQSVETRTNSLALKLRRNGVPDEGDLDDQCQIPSFRESDSIRYLKLCGDAKDKRRDTRMLRRDGDEAVFDRNGIAHTAGLDELCKRRDRISQSAAEFDRLTKQISDIKAEIEHATRESGLEAAEKNMDEAIAKSLDWLAFMAKAVANRTVLEAIETATRKENTTPVIESADKWLERLTRHRYGALKEDGKSVTVQDRDGNDRVQPTEQLSTGTKVHLALAVRLAVIEQSETLHVRFPLFLDEVMATSDLNARRALAEALKEISLERQVVVLTNQPDDVHLLEETIGSELSIVVLPGHEPVPVAPPAIAPQPANRPVEVGLPLHSTVRRWRASLVEGVLESTPVPEGARVDEVLRISQNQNDLALVDAIEAVRKEVAKSYREIEWKDISGVDLGGSDMRDKVQLAWQNNRTRPRAFLESVDQIKGRRTALVERLTDRLEELQLLIDHKPPAREQLIEIALADLPEHMQILAGDVVDVFRDYLSLGD